MLQQIVPEHCDGGTDIAVFIPKQIGCSRHIGVVEGDDFCVFPETACPRDRRRQSNAHIFRDVLADKIGVVADNMDLGLKTVGSAPVVGEGILGGTDGHCDEFFAPKLCKLHRSAGGKRIVFTDRKNNLLPDQRTAVMHLPVGLQRGNAQVIYRILIAVEIVGDEEGDLRVQS